MARMREPDEPVIAGKLTARVGGRKVVFRKHPRESVRHVLLKALVFALYLPDYPDLVVEPPRSERYTPDLVAWDAAGSAIFWAECGETGREKLGWLLKHRPAAHLVLAKQRVALGPWLALVRDLADGARREAPVELVLAPPDADRFIGADGSIEVARDDVEIVRLGRV